MTSISFDVATDHPAFSGHFPGWPLLPGVLLVAEVLEAVLADPALARAVGPAPRLAAVKFHTPVGPGAALTVRFEATPTALRFEIAEGTRVAASGSFERVPARAEAASCAAPAPSTR